MKGKFIVLEGMDGAGKTEQVTRLANALASNDVETVMVREPGGTEAGEKIREIIRTTNCQSGTAEMLLFQAARAELTETVIAPAIAAGKCVIADRFASSTVAYQGYGRGVALPAISAATDIATGGLRPDLTIWLDVSEGEATRRTTSRADARDAIESRDESFAAAVRRGYEDQCGPGWARINADQDAEEVAAAVWAAVKKELDK